MIPAFFDSFATEFVNDNISLIGVIVRWNILGEQNRNPPNCAILDNRDFENFMLADEAFVKALRIF